MSVTPSGNSASPAGLVHKVGEGGHTGQNRLNNEGRGGSLRILQFHKISRY